MGGGGSRPVVTAPIDALVARADATTKRWLLELLAAAPLSAAGDVRAAALAADGPGLCAAVAEALGSDRRLDSALAAAADVRRLSGARDAGGAVAAAEALRRAAWATVRDQVPPDDDHLLAALGDRLAHVCALLAQAATRGMGEEAPTEQPPVEGIADSAVPAPEAAIAAPAPATLWMAALERQIGARRRFALLLMELEGMERLRLAEPPEALARALERAGRAVRQRIRREDILAHETDGRLWVIAPGVGRGGASALARRVARAVEEAAELRGAPLTASVGAALFPDDARDPAELAGEAEEGVLAARAAGVRFAGDSDEPPVGPRLVP